MKWITGDQYYITSECGRFRIAKVFVQTVPVYTLWSSAGDKWVSVGSFDSADKAKIAAEDFD